MGTKIEFYQRLREHIPDEAARLIAEEALVESRVVTEDRFVAELEKLRSSLFRWMLVFFAPLWVGVLVFGTLNAATGGGATTPTGGLLALMAISVAAADDLVEPAAEQHTVRKISGLAVGPMS